LKAARLDFPRDRPNLLAMRAHAKPTVHRPRISAMLGLGVRLALLAVLVPPLAGLTSVEAFFAPKPKLWARWQTHDPAATARMDHGAWNRIVGTYVAPDGAGVNRFDYAGVSAPDRLALDRYVARLAALPVSRYARAEQFAYWINLYNALTVQLVLAHYPVDSIRDIDISPGLFADGPWDKPLVTIEGQAVTLNDIEHRILRPIWRDPRIHYALNCASVGCPNLQRRAFTAAGTEALLEAAARGYVNSPRGLRFAKGRLIVSSIYVWFSEDFGGDDAAIIAHLRRYAKPALAARLAGIKTLGGHAYDWALNGRIGPPS
jgi:hypothetical protein